MQFVKAMALALVVLGSGAATVMAQTSTDATAGGAKSGDVKPEDVKLEDGKPADGLGLGGDQGGPAAKPADNKGDK